MQERFQIGFLDGILGLRIIFQNASGYAKQALIVAPHDGGECVLVPGKTETHQPGVGCAIQGLFPRWRIQGDHDAFRPPD
jgi:hypothetical protein